MSQTNTSKRQLIIIDSQVNDWQRLANTVSTDSLLLILDSSSDGLTQISDYLTALSATAGSEDFAPLQSIHILSHGSAGTLLLGSSTLTGNNLSLYSSQLTSIGKSLTETGDILLYGCDVAQGEIGNEFIQSLAQVTGADVAASDDLTGAVALGGDGVLEIVAGNIEAQTLPVENYSGVLSNITTTNISFAVNDASLFGVPSLSHTFNGMVWDFADKHINNNLNQRDVPGLSEDLHYDINVTNLSAGFPINFSATAGTYDLAYPVQASFLMPNTVRHGDDFEVNTKLLSVNAPSLSILGPQLGMKISAMFNADVNGFIQLDDQNDIPAVIDLWGVDPFSVSIPINKQIGLTYDIFDITNGSLAESEKLLTLTNSGNWRWTNEVLGGRTVKKAPLLSVGYDIDTDLSGTSEERRYFG